MSNKINPPTATNSSLASSLSYSDSELKSILESRIFGLAKNIEATEKSKLVAAK